MSGRLMIYGATGYTGELVSREAVRRGLDPVVAGRNGEKVGHLAAELGVQNRVFSLADHDSIVRSLDGVSVVLNVAGPFGATAGPLLAASIAAGVHYLDTTAELATFLLAESLNEEALAAGVMVMSGTGWDVVPSDGLAARTAARVKEPVTLRLALKLFTGDPDVMPPALMFSRGSIASAQDIGDLAGSLRINGRLQRREDMQSRLFEFGTGPEEASPAPMGDLVTAWRSTKIPNIEVYIHNGIPLPDLTEGKELPDGPSAQERSIGRSRVAAEVVGSDGTTVRGLVDTPTGYTFTQLASVEIAARVLNGSFRPGFQSPSSAYGPDLVPSIADSHFIDL